MRVSPTSDLRNESNYLLRTFVNRTQVHTELITFKYSQEATDSLNTVESDIFFCETIKDLVENKIEESNKKRSFGGGLA